MVRHVCLFYPDSLYNLSLNITILRIYVITTRAVSGTVYLFTEYHSVMMPISWLKFMLFCVLAFECVTQRFLFRCVTLRWRPSIVYVNEFWNYQHLWCCGIFFSGELGALKDRTLVTGRMLAVLFDIYQLKLIAIIFHVHFFVHRHSWRSIEPQLCSSFWQIWSNGREE